MSELWVYVASSRGSAIHPTRHYTNDLPTLLWVKEMAVLEVRQIRIIGCPVCWGKGVICTGLKENLKPILEPCTGCDGTGWIAFGYIDKEKDNDKGRTYRNT